MQPEDRIDRNADEVWEPARKPEPWTRGPNYEELPVVGTLAEDVEEA